MDATLEENKGLSSKYGVQGFPTLKVRASLLPPCHSHESQTPQACHLKQQLGPDPFGLHANTVLACPDRAQMHDLTRHFAYM